jgi:hypothetical protein
MAKKSTARTKEERPHLAAAVFCERSIIDQEDGSVSIVRIIDKIEMILPSSAPPDFPSETNRIQIPLHVFLSFKTGESPGNHTVRCIMESPSGKRGKIHEHTLPFTPEPFGGANLRLNAVIAIFKGGIFWLHVYLDGRRVARMPISITIRREPSPEDQDAKTNGAIT